MASAMMCPAHGKLSGDVCEVPGCLEPLQPYVDRDTPTCPAPSCDMPLPCPLHPGEGMLDAGHREAVAYLAASAPSPQPDAGAADTPALQFPWGPVGLGAQPLIVGRDFASQCGRQVEDLANVSRRHAQITLRNGQIFVEDLASTNGTTINGNPATAYQPEPVNDGDVLGFGAHLRVVVRNRKDRG